MIQCRYCRSKNNFIKAHAIPEAFFRELREGKKFPFLISGRLGEFSKISPIGVYDEAILCDGCEKKFLAVDTYGIEVLLTAFNKHFSPIIKDSEVEGFVGATVDKSLMLRFLLAVLWRASVSTHRFYEKVDLGQYEAEVLNLINNPGRPIPTVFDAVLSRWNETEVAGTAFTGILNPYRRHLDGVSVYRLYLGQLVVEVKVDRQPFAGALSSLSLQSGAPCCIVSRSLTKSNDLQAMIKTVHTSDKNKIMFRAKRGPNV